MRACRAAEQLAGWATSGAGDSMARARIISFGGTRRLGEVITLLMNGLAIKDSGSVRVVADFDWQIARIADFDDDGRADILWRYLPTGQNYMWLMNGRTIRPSEGYVTAMPPPNWTAIGK